jgi:hypothetical protein
MKMKRRLPTKRCHDYREGPCELCGAGTCAMRPPGDPLWREHAESKFLAQANGRDVKHWPSPCEVCGVEYKLTPAGRWFIEHAFPHGKPGVFATQPMERPAAPQDPLLDERRESKPERLKDIFREIGA